MYGRYRAARLPSPSGTLLTRLLDQHYSLTLNDTPFVDERVIEQHIEAGISLCDAVNFRGKIRTGTN
ncbi:hypothetical protein ECZU50_29360 [Escherichia coli]|nr:hypothetical protein ECZU50_29360 [Escherichia coli]